MSTQKITASAAEADQVMALQERVEARLASVLAPSGRHPEMLLAAMRDATLAGGKRVRPVLCVLVNSAAGGRNAEFALAAGVAVELVHCASLILDDLPCMDDARLRRGRPTIHRTYGEATAILAAIGLMNLAYEQLAKAPVDCGETRARALELLTAAIGTSGLVAGQEMDLRDKARAQTTEEVDHINWLKTGVLFEAATEIGARAAGASEAQIAAMRDFTRHLGLAFQTRDDILDQVATSAETGKDAHKDDHSTTLIRLAGLDAAARDCRAHLASAARALERSGLPHTEISALVERVFAKVSQQPG